MTRNMDVPAPHNLLREIFGAMGVSYEKFIKLRRRCGDIMSNNDRCARTAKCLKIVGDTDDEHQYKRDDWILFADVGYHEDEVMSLYLLMNIFHRVIINRLRDTCDPHYDFFKKLRMHMNSQEYQTLQKSIGNNFIRRVHLIIQLFKIISPQMIGDVMLLRKYNVPSRLILYDPCGEIVFVNDDSDNRPHHVIINDVCPTLYHPDWGYAPVGAYYGELHMLPRPALAT